MELTGDYAIPASREDVWQALNDVDVLKECIPGCDTLDRQSDTEMTASVTAKVGPVKAKFKGRVLLSDIDAPNGYRIDGEGQGGAAGFAKGGAIVNLASQGNETLLTYKVDATVGGKLAQIGQRFIDATAKKMADEFFSALAQQLSPIDPEPTQNAITTSPAGSDHEGVPAAIWVTGLVFAATLFLLALINM